MNRKQGFTLVELLVVIAIIAILASIVIPRVNGALLRARMTKAAAEIRGAETAVVKMFADVEKQSLDKFFSAPDALYNFVVWAVEHDIAAEQVYSDIFYELLRRGKGATFDFYYMRNAGAPTLQLAAPVARKLGTSYMELGADAFGTHPYFFFAGPLTASDLYSGKHAASPFRSYRPPLNPDDENPQPYVYTQLVKEEVEDRVMRGNPDWDDAFGYPSPKDLPVYIWSYGDNEVSDQALGGGDDINNWDNANGWSAFY